MHFYYQTWQDKRQVEQKYNKINDYVTLYHDQKLPIILYPKEQLHSTTAITPSYV